jgi:hypothetical protein
MMSAQKVTASKAGASITAFPGAYVRTRGILDKSHSAKIFNIIRGI